MFDFISISTNRPETRQAILNLCNEQLIDREKTISQHGEELHSGRETIYYSGIKILLLRNSHIKLMFSLHKLYNELNCITDYKGEGMNHDTFTYEKMSYIIVWLEQMFSLDLNQTNIHQLEFGFNLPNLSIDSQKLIERFISYKGKRFNKLNTIGQGNGIDVSFDKYYRLKIYDKSLQYKLDHPIVRIEYKALRIKPVYTRIFSEDNRFIKLLDKATWLKCYEMLREQIQFCIINDIIDQKNLKPYEKLKYLEWSNPYFWENCKPDIRSKSKKKFNLIVEKYGVIKAKKKILESFQNQYSLMLENGNDFH